jgi:hypothetical protein
MKKILLTATAVAILAASAVGGALAAGLLVLQPGQGVTVAKTSINCGVATQKGKNLISCYKTGTNGAPLPGSFGVTISQSHVWVVKMAANAKGKIIFQKKG